MMTISIVSVTNACVSMFLYSLIHSRIKMRTMLLIGGILSIAGAALLALANSLPLLYTAAFISGAGLSVQSSNTCVLVINSWFKKRSGTLFGLAQTCGNIGGFLSTAIFTFLINALGWRMPLWITTGIIAVMVVVVQFLYKGTPEELGESAMFSEDENALEKVTMRQNDGTTFKQMLKTTQFYILIAGYIFVGLAAYAAIGNLPLFAADLGYGSFSGTFLSVALVGSAATMILGGVIIDRFGTRDRKSVV